MGIAWAEEVGAVLTRDERRRKYGGSTQGGIEPSALSDNVFIYSDPAKGNRHGYHFDGWDPDREIFLYTGDGQRGPQKMVGGNKSILEHRQNGKSLRVFIADGVVPGSQTKRHLYIGEFTLADDVPYTVEQAPDLDGLLRDVFVWRLRPVGSDYLRRDRDLSSLAAEGPDSATVETVQWDDPESGRFGDSFNVPLERTTAEYFDVAATQARTAERRESALVSRYAKHLESLGREVCRRKIRPAGKLLPMFTDLYDVTIGELYEAKGTAQRDDVRMAIGQLFDYRRHMPAGTALTVLLPHRPSADVLDVILHVGLSCVHETPDGFRRID